LLTFTSFNDPATTEIYTLSLHDALPIFLFADDFAYKKITNLWETTTGPSVRNYIVETAQSVVQRCMLMTTDPGDLVFDPTCGSRSEEHTSELQSRENLVCRLLLEKKK